MSRKLSIISKARLWRLRRAYRRIAILEMKVGQKALDERMSFVRDTLLRIDQMHAANLISRQTRRQMKRELVNSHA